MLNIPLCFFSLLYNATNTEYSSYWVILELHVCLAQSLGRTYTYRLHSLTIWFSLFLCAKMFCLLTLHFTCLVLAIMQGQHLQSAPSILLCLNLPAFWALFSFLYFSKYICSLQNTPRALKGCCICQVSLGYSNISHCEVSCYCSIKQFRWAW